MGLFKKIKKAVKKVAKIALKTAPIWTSFIPGGSIVGNVISRVTQAREKVMGVKKALGLGRAAAARGQPTAGSHIAMQAARSYAEEDAFESQGVVHAGIKGPVPQRMYGHRLTPSNVADFMRAGGGRRGMALGRGAGRGAGRAIRRAAPATQRRPRKLKFGSKAWRARYAPRRRRRRAA